MTYLPVSESEEQELKPRTFRLSDDHMAKLAFISAADNRDMTKQLRHLIEQDYAAKTTDAPTPTAG